MQSSLLIAVKLRTEMQGEEKSTNFNRREWFERETKQHQTARDAETQAQRRERLDDANQKSQFYRYNNSDAGHLSDKKGGIGHREENDPVLLANTRNPHGLQSACPQGRNTSSRRVQTPKSLHPDNRIPSTELPANDEEDTIGRTGLTANAHWMLTKEREVQKELNNKLEIATRRIAELQKEVRDIRSDFDRVPGDEWERKYKDARSRLAECEEEKERLRAQLDESERRERSLYARLRDERDDNLAKSDRTVVTQNLPEHQLSILQDELSGLGRKIDGMSKEKEAMVDLKPIDRRQRRQKGFARNKHDRITYVRHIGAKDSP
jgi:hypothetical protein